MFPLTLRTNYTLSIKMFQKTDFEGLWVFEPKIFEDERGFFYESFNQKQFSESTGIHKDFVQDNHSFSKYGVLRGLHFQKPPHQQAKLVRVLNGEVLDVVVDIRSKSATYQKVFTILLSAENKKQLYVPQGFAHGFVVLSDYADFTYKCDNYYFPQSEAGIIYKDEILNIDWKLPEELIVVSKKDLLLPQFLANPIYF